MQAYLALVRREFSSYFVSLTGYVIVAGILFLLGVSFTLMLMAYNGDSLNVPLTELFHSTMFFWLILLIATPVMTMRVFSLEKFSGTFETLMTTPVGDAQVVLAKYSAAMLFYLIGWLPLLACLRIVHAYTGQSTAFAWMPVASTFLGILLVGSAYVAMGCFASALTRSQIVAAMISFALGISLFLISFANYSVALQHGLGANIVRYLAVIDHMEDFARGMVDTRRIVFYLSLTAFFLFLTYKAVESRRWK